MFKHSQVVSKPENSAMPWLVCPGLLKGLDLFIKGMSRSNQVMYVRII